MTIWIWSPGAAAAQSFSEEDESNAESKFHLYMTNLVSSVIWLFVKL